MISAKALIDLFKQAEVEKWGYIWGTRGQVWTQASQNKATREKTVQYGQKWVGRRVADCSGLFVWAYDQLGADIYHGSNTIWNKYTSKTGEVCGEVEIMPGTAVFQVKNGTRHHIGLYIGGGKCIEAHGTQRGVIVSELTAWDEWGLLKDVDYSGIVADVIHAGIKTLRKGDTGMSVTWLQELLLAAGYGVGKVDGIFGSKTLAAVKAFQRANGLTVDGIAGKMTIAALTGQHTEPEDEPVEADEWEGMTTEEKLADLNMRLKELEGGEPNG